MRISYCLDVLFECERTPGFGGNRFNIYNEKPSDLSLPGITTTVLTAVPPGEASESSGGAAEWWPFNRFNHTS